MTPEAALRVAMVCPYDLARPGGVQGQATGLAAALRRAGHRVLLVAPDAHAALGGVAEDRFVPGRSLGVRANGSVAPVVLDPLAAGRAERAVVRWGADVVHLHEPFAPTIGYGVLARHPCPVVATFHRAGTGAAYRVMGPVLRWATGRFDAAFAVSESAKATAAHVGARCSVLFNGIDLDRFASRSLEKAVPPAIVFLGRHEPRKGLGVLLAAHAAMAEPAELWICGDGPQTAQLRAAHPASDRVRWLGVVDDDEVAARLARAAVLCAPSLGGESFGMVLVEGLAAGCRVVASDIEGYRAAAGGHAVLVAAGDAGALARALDTAVREPWDAARASRARTHAEQWSMGTLAARYETAYRQVVGAGRPRPSV